MSPDGTRVPALRSLQTLIVGEPSDLALPDVGNLLTWDHSNPDLPGKVAGQLYRDRNRDRSSHFVELAGSAPR